MSVRQCVRVVNSNDAKEAKKCQSLLRYLFTFFSSHQFFMERQGLLHIHPSVHASTCPGAQRRKEWGHLFWMTRKDHKSTLAKKIRRGKKKDQDLFSKASWWSTQKSGWFRSPENPWGFLQLEWKFCARRISLEVKQTSKKCGNCGKKVTFFLLLFLIHTLCHAWIFVSSGEREMSGSVFSAPDCKTMMKRKQERRKVEKKN